MSFTCFDKFKGVLDSIPDEADRKTMALAIIEYGLTGEDPAFGYPLSAIFEGVREDIDNSRDARGKNKGGRPKGSRNKPKPAPSPAPETPGEEESEVSDGENGVSKTKNPRFQFQKPPFPKLETQTRPSQYRPSQAMGTPYPLRSSRCCASRRCPTSRARCTPRCPRGAGASWSAPRAASAPTRYGA